MTNAIERYMRFMPDGPRFKYISPQLITGKVVRNTRNIGRDVVQSFRQRITGNQKFRHMYAENNIFRYLDETWKGAKSRRFILNGNNSIATGSDILTISRLCQLVLFRNFNISHKKTIYTFNGIYSKKDVADILHGPQYNTDTSNLDNIKIGDIYYISVYDLINQVSKIYAMLTQQGIDMEIIYMPTWALGIWIRITGVGVKPASRHIYQQQVNMVLETCGLVLSGYIGGVNKIATDADYAEMFEMIAFNQCYTIARDLGLNVRSRYLNEFGGPKEFIFTQNRFIGDLYPRIPDDRQMDLMMTNVGLYSISRPKDSARIASMIVNECRRVLRTGNIDKLTITDGTAGVGGDTIAFAQAGFKGVNSCEIIPEHCRVVANNVSVFGLEDKVRVMCGDYMTQYSDIKQDVIYIDAPWGGVGYDADEDSSGLKLFGNIKFVTFIKQVLNNKNTARLIVLKVPSDFNGQRLNLDKRRYRSHERTMGNIRLIIIRKN